MSGFSDQLQAALPDLWRYAYALTRDRHQADDLVQDTVERALRKRRLWIPGRPLKPWLAKILLNRFRNDRRSAGLRAAQPIDQMVEIAAPNASPEQRIELREVQDNIARLTPERREALMLVVIGGLSYKEAAKALEIPLGTLMSRIARARTDLKNPVRPEPRLRRVK